MKSTTDYVAAALAALPPPATENPAPEVVTPPAETATTPPDGSEEHKSSTPETPVDGEVAAAPEVKAEPPKTEEKPKLQTRVDKGLEDIAREKAALRADREKLKADAAILEEAKELLEAAKSGDALKLMARAKIPWSKAAKQVLDGDTADEPVAPAKPSPELSRIEALEREIAARNARDMQAQVTAKMSARVEAEPEKFKYTKHFGDEALAQARVYIETYFAQTGELPSPGNPDESLEIALEAVEAHLVKESKRWSSVLTPGTPVATVPGSKAVVPAVGATSQKAAAKTLTNQVASGPNKTPSDAPKKAQTSDDYIAATLEALTAQ